MEDTQADMYVTENVLLFNKAHPFSLAGQLRATLQSQGYTHTHRTMSAADNGGKADRERYLSTDLKKNAKVGPLL